MQDKEFYPDDLFLPNIIVLTDVCAEWDQWRDAIESINGLRYVITDNPDEALCEWINLFSHDFIPRAIVCSANIKKECMGIEYGKTQTGTQFAIDGSSFVLYQCMQAVGYAEGMFCLFTDSFTNAAINVGMWDDEKRVHILERGTEANKYTPKRIVNYIVNHDEYVLQSLASRKKIS